MTNAELFDVIAAQIFAKCLDSHPIGVDLQFVTVAYEATPGNEDPDLQSRATDVARSTFAWLEREGYLHVGNVAQSMSHGITTVYEVTLTSKSLAVLGAYPDVLQPTVSIGEKIRLAVRIGSATAMKEAVKLAIAAGAGSFS